MTALTETQSNRFFSQTPLALALITGMLLISFESPAWIALLSFALVFLKYFAELKNWKLWPPWFSALVGILLGLEVYIRLGTLLGQESTVTWVLGLTALKITDYRNQRDKKFLILLGFVLLSLKPLFSLDIYWLLPTMIGFFLLWHSMLEPPQPAPLRYLLRLFVGALPFAAVLFFTFPRLATPLITGRAMNQGGIGFSEIFDPGGIGRIQTSEESVFRARFDDPSFKPETRDLYWRGIVHTVPDQMRWTSVSRPSKSVPATDLQSLPGQHYEITIEPKNSSYIFVLEKGVAVQSTEPLLQIEKNTYQTKFLQMNRWSYRAVSQIGDTQNQAPTKEEMRPPSLFNDKAKNIRVQELVKLISQKTPDLKARRLQLDQFFIEGGFTYTLEPGTYGVDAMEEFLFVRKRGYCEHFAGAYATLARALGIPSRVVGGYQGGTLNAFGKFWQVSSKDAHAWVEIWEDSKWIRIDPTGLVAPTRIELGGGSYFLSVAARTAAAYGVLPFLETVQMFFENLNFQWVRFMLDFAGSRDPDWLKNLRGLAIMLMVTIGLWILLQIRGPQRITAAKLTPSQRDFLKIEKLARAQNLVRAKHEPPLQFLARTAQNIPDLRQAATQLAIKYSAENYRKNGTRLVDK